MLNKTPNGKKKTRSTLPFSNSPPVYFVFCKNNAKTRVKTLLTHQIRSLATIQCIIRVYTLHLVVLCALERNIFDQVDSKPHTFDWQQNEFVIFAGSHYYYYYYSYITSFFLKAHIITRHNFSRLFSCAFDKFVGRRLIIKGLNGTQSAIKRSSLWILLLLCTLSPALSLLRWQTYLLFAFNNKKKIIFLLINLFGVPLGKFNYFPLLCDILWPKNKMKVSPAESQRNKLNCFFFSELQHKVLWNNNA